MRLRMWGGPWTTYFLPPSTQPERPRIPGEERGHKADNGLLEGYGGARGVRAYGRSVGPVQTGGTEIIRPSGDRSSSPSFRCFTLAALALE